MFLDRHVQWWFLPLMAVVLLQYCQEPVQCTCPFPRTHQLMTNYCEWSHWLPWNCTCCGTNVAGYNTLAERRRGVCCNTSQTLDNCLKSCGYTRNDGRETEQCHVACGSKTTVSSCIPPAPPPVPPTLATAVHRACPFMLTGQILSYCEFSDWLPWNCSKCVNNFPGNTIKTQRLRAICCDANHTVDSCLKECGQHPHGDREIELCIKVCPLDHTTTSLTFKPTTTSASTLRSTKTTTKNVPTTSKSASILTSLNATYSSTSMTLTSTMVVPSMAVSLQTPKPISSVGRTTKLILTTANITSTTRIPTTTTASTTAVIPTTSPLLNTTTSMLVSTVTHISSTNRTLSSSKRTAFSPIASTLPQNMTTKIKPSAPAFFLNTTSKRATMTPRHQTSTSTKRTTIRTRNSSSSTLTRHSYRRSSLPPRNASTSTPTYRTSTARAQYPGNNTSPTVSSEQGHWCYLGPFRLKSNPHAPISICVLILICICVVLAIIVAFIVRRLCRKKEEARSTRVNPFIPKLADSVW